LSGGDDERGIIQPSFGRVNLLNAIFVLAQSNEASMLLKVLLCAATVLAGVLIWRTGAFRPTSVIGPERTGRVQTRPLAILLLASVTIWFAVQAGFVAFQGKMHEPPAGKAFDPETLTTNDWAFLSVVPGTVGIILLIAGHLGGRTNAPKELGFSPSQFLPGFLGGLLGLVVVLPIMLWCIIFLEWFYDRIHLQHPNEHDLLRALAHPGETSAKIAIIIGATVIAPVFEEFVFRAHLQTLLVRLFTETRTSARGFALNPELPGGGDAVASVVEVNRSPGRIWLGILISSIVFALIHPPWMAPAIFVLSLCLGYLYQRTGYLWATIVLHSLFNVFNTMMFLAQTRPH
jgi:membrane protease YdiL (CAAX protease family)